MKTRAESDRESRRVRFALFLLVEFEDTNSENVEGICIHVSAAVCDCFVLDARV